MKKLFLILVLLNPLLVFAKSNDCKTDVYFANGILTEDWQANDNAKILKVAIKNLLGTEAYTQQIGKVSYSYNHTIGYFSDGIETFLQKFGWLGWRDWLGNVHGVDVHIQVLAYQASINNKHKILVVADSQGKLILTAV